MIAKIVTILKLDILGIIIAGAIHVRYEQLRTGVTSPQSWGLRHKVLYSTPRSGEMLTDRMVAARQFLTIQPSKIKWISNG